ncbi:MAG: hypothetical protein AMJ91_00810 [candidate division Zixibacteria bacterium SM23_73_3]|nr:MAG: hypothetical protein AMJ91_00810 [candidate division Zixibacteria bacterium SM23_73_3]
MLSSSEKEEFEEKRESIFRLSSNKKTGKKISHILPRSKRQNQNTDKHTSDGITEKAGLSDDSSPIRKEKVKEAKTKKENGDYDSQEIYQKIADRLMDLFGI